MRFIEVLNIHNPVNPLDSTCTWIPGFCIPYLNWIPTYSVQYSSRDGPLRCKASLVTYTKCPFFYLYLDCLILILNLVVH